MENSNFRFYVKVRCILGISPKIISNELKSAFGNEAPSYSFVLKWAKLFKGGRQGVEDAQRSGRPITALTNENIDLVRALIEEDPYVTYDQIEASTSLTPPTIHAIIHMHLKLRKITSRWVPHHLTQKNKEDRVAICKENLANIEAGRFRLCDIITGDESWFYHRKLAHKQNNKSWVGEGETPRTFVRREMHEAKTMFSVFFKSTGLVYITYMDKGRTIDNQFYIENCLKPVVSSINASRPKSGTTNVKFHHDNARPHIHRNVISYLEEQNIRIIRHPPYSPDLAPCDFWLFDHIKQRLTDHKDSKSLLKAITGEMKQISRLEYLKTFEKWVERMNLCIQHHGEYFEHLIK